MCGKKQHVSKYNQKLQEEGKVWIGYTECSKIFAETHADTIIEQARIRSKIACSKYKCKYLEKDFASDAIVFILQMCGDIDKNFSNKKDVAENMIIGRIYTYIRNKCLSNFSKVKKILDEVRFTNYKGEDQTFDRQIKDEIQNVEEEVIERLVREKTEENFEETCIRLLKKNIELGYDRSETVTRTAEALDIDPEEMLQKLQKYMLEQKRARETESGGIVIGE